MGSNIDLGYPSLFVLFGIDMISTYNCHLWTLLAHMLLYEFNCIVTQIVYNLKNNRPVTIIAFMNTT